MLDVYDSETIVKIYRMLKKKCEAIDRFINNHSLYYGTDCLEYGAADVFENIIDLMERKNQLINLKIIVDSAVKSLDVSAKKLLYIKMNYNISMDEVCSILEMKERTAFRWVERAFNELAQALNKSKYLEKLESIMHSESWIKDIKENVKDRRQALKYRAVSV